MNIKKIGIVLALFSAVVFTGCTSISGTRATNGQLTIKATSFMTSVDGMQFSCQDSNGFVTTLDLQKAGVDNQALTTVTGGLLKMAELGATFAAKAPTNLPTIKTNAP